MSKLEQFLDKHGSEILAGGFGVTFTGVFSAMMLMLWENVAASIVCAIVGFLGSVAMAAVVTNDFRPKRRP